MRSHAERTQERSLGSHRCRIRVRGQVVPEFRIIWNHNLESCLVLFSTSCCFLRELACPVEWETTAWWNVLFHLCKAWSLFSSPHHGSVGSVEAKKVLLQLYCPLALHSHDKCCLKPWWERLKDEYVWTALSNVGNVPCFFRWLQIMPTLKNMVLVGLFLF